MKQFIYLSVIFILASCGGSNPDKSAQLKELKAKEAELKTQIAALEKELAGDSLSPQIKSRPVSVLTTQKIPFFHYIEIQGMVDADENVSVSAKMPGVITKIRVQEGDQVKAGQILAEMDNEAIAKGVEEVRTQLAFANTIYLKQKNLWDQKIGSEMQYLTAKNNKESMEKRLSTMEEQLDGTLLKAPISGIVDEIRIKVGQALAPGFPSVRVVNLNSLKVKGNVAEGFLSKVKKGNKVEIIFPDLGDTLATEISYAGKVIDELNRTFSVLVDLKNGEKYAPNMITIMRIIDYSNPEAITVPVKLINKSAEGDFIFVEENKAARKKKIRLGQTYNGLAEVVEGLKPGDHVISAGYMDLNEGEALNIEM